MTLPTQRRSCGVTPANSAQTTALHMKKTARRSIISVPPRVRTTASQRALQRGHQLLELNCRIDGGCGLSLEERVEPVVARDLTESHGGRLDRVRNRSEKGIGQLFGPQRS